MKRKKVRLAAPELEQLKKELRRTNYNREYGRVLRSTVYTLIIVAAAAILVAVLLLPVLQINSHTMIPTLAEGDIVVCVKTGDVQQGDIVSFFIGSKLLVKRCIALPGQWIDIDEEGNIFIDGQLLQEPYIPEHALGDCNIEFPYQVPSNRYFCVGDHRAASIDSRNTAVGCISQEQLVGKVVFRVWPIPVFGPIA